MIPAKHEEQGPLREVLSMRSKPRTQLAPSCASISRRVILGLSCGHKLERDRPRAAPEFARCMECRDAGAAAVAE